MNFANIAKNIFILITLSYTLSCVSGPDVTQKNVNRKFESIYGSQVKQILEQKNAPAINYDNISPKITNFNIDSEYKKYTTPSQIFNIDSPVNQRSKFATYKLFLKEPQMHFPDMNTFKEGRKNFSANKIPSDIFDIKYNTAQHPPFRITGIDFDLIVIPQKDAYGISSSLEDKTYPLPPRNIVAKNVQYLLSKRSADDIEFSREIIAENELIRKQIAVNKLYFAENYEKPSADYEKIFNEDNSEEDWVIKRRDLEKDKINKLIRNQVVIKNLITGLSNKRSNENQPNNNGNDTSSQNNRTNNANSNTNSSRNNNKNFR